jgi:hypothetical protein
LPAKQAFRRGGVVVEDIANVAGFPSRIADGVSGVAYLELRELFNVVFDHGGKPPQEARLVRGGNSGPSRLRRRCLRDGFVGLLDRCERDLGHQFLGRGIDDVEYAIHVTTSSGTDEQRAWVGKSWLTWEEMLLLCAMGVP